MAQTGYNKCSCCGKMYKADGSEEKLYIRDHDLEDYYEMDEENKLNNSTTTHHSNKSLFDLDFDDLVSALLDSRVSTIHSPSNKNAYS